MIIKLNRSTVKCAGFYFLWGKMIFPKRTFRIILYKILNCC